MKSRISLPLVGLFFSLSICPVFCQEGLVVSPEASSLEKNIIPYVQLDIMCAQNAFKSQIGIDSMKAYSNGLDEFYTSFLYKKYSKDIGSAIVLNVLSGGLGSWGMGDKLSGALLETGMIISWGCAFFAMTGAGQQYGTTFSTLAVISAGVVTAGGIAMPLLYGIPYNRRLKAALSLGK